MKTEELELQFRRVELGRKIQTEINSLNELYKRVSESRSLVLFANRHGAISELSYGNEVVKSDWVFSMLSKQEIEELMDGVRTKMLKKISDKVLALKKQFEDI